MNDLSLREIYAMFWDSLDIRELFKDINILKAEDLRKDHIEQISKII